MNSLACLSAAPRRVLFGLLLNDVCVFCIPLFSLLFVFFPVGLMGFCGVMFSILISAFQSCDVLASLKSKVKKNKMTTAGEAIEYRCLIRATDGKKTISTSVCVFCPFYSVHVILFVSLVIQVTSLRKEVGHVSELGNVW
jgi:hypothetical protein